MDCMRCGGCDLIGSNSKPNANTFSTPMMTTIPATKQSIPDYFHIDGNCSPQNNNWSLVNFQPWSHPLSAAKASHHTLYTCPTASLVVMWCDVTPYQPHTSHGRMATRSQFYLGKYRLFLARSLNVLLTFRLNYKTTLCRAQKRSVGATVALVCPSGKLDFYVRSLCL